MEAPAGWDDVAARGPAGHVMQSSAWARIRQAQGWRPEFLRMDAGGAALVLWKRTPLGELAYVPRGPVGELQLTRSVALAALATHARERGALFLKVDPEVDRQEWGPIYQSAGYRRGADVQPVLATLELDLGSDEERLFAGLDKDTRWSVRAAPKRGVEIRVGHGDSDLLAFYDLYARTGKRAGFIPRAWPYYRLVWRTLIDARLATLRLAEVEGRAHAGAMTWLCGERALYMYGATATEGRKSLAAYPLQWECIVAAKREGRRRYDFGGMPVAGADSDDPMYGPYLFKKGFGGTPRRFAGAYDFVPRELPYRAYSILEPLYTRAIQLKGALG